MLVKESTGDVHQHKMSSNGTVGAKTKDGKWRVGWSNVEYYSVGGQPYVFLLMKSSVDTEKLIKLAQALSGYVNTK